VGGYEEFGEGYRLGLVVGGFEGGTLLGGGYAPGPDGG